MKPRLFSLLITLAFSSFTSSLALDGESIKIGIIASLTGPADEEGRNWLEGAQLAADQLIKDGIKLELVVEDDETKPASLVKAFNKMVAVDKVQAIVGGTWDFLGEAAYPLARQHKIPFITPTNPSEIINKAERSNPYIFSNSLTLAAEREAIKEFLKLERPASITILEALIPWGTAHADLMQELAAELSIPVRSRLSFSYDSYPDVLRTLALKISAYPAGLVFGGLDYLGIDYITKEFKKLKITTILLTPQHLEDAFVLGKDAERFRRCYAVYPKVIDPKFSEAFKAKHKHAPKVYAAHGYDAVMFLVQAFTAGVKLQDPTTSFVYQGVTGEHRLPTKDRGLVRNKAVMMTTRDGLFKEWN